MYTLIFIIRGLKYVQLRRNLRFLCIKLGSHIREISEYVICNELSHLWKKLNKAQVVKILNKVGENTPVYNVLMDLHPLCRIYLSPVEATQPTKEYLKPVSEDIVNRIKSHNITPIEFISSLYYIFSKYEWEKNYGGRQWYNICVVLTERLIPQLESFNYKDLPFSIDNILSYEHNTGFLLSKLDCLKDIKNVLDEIHNNKQIKNLLPKCSFQLQEMEVLQRMDDESNKLGMEDLFNNLRKDMDINFKLMLDALSVRDENIITHVKHEIELLDSLTNNIEENHKESIKEINELKFQFKRLEQNFNDNLIKVGKSIESNNDVVKCVLENQLTGLKTSLEQSVNEIQSLLFDQQRMIDKINSELSMTLYQKIKRFFINIVKRKS